MDIVERLDHIEKKINALKRQNVALKNEIESLQTLKLNLQAAVASQKVEIFNLQEQNKIIKLAASLPQKEKREDLLEQIDFLMDEIDECIKTIKM